MEFVETKTFNKQITELLSDDEYMALQVVLTANPKSGAVIPGGHGLRKLRWAGSGRGKRGGIRLIYYIITEDKLLMILAFAKSRKSDLSKDQLQQIADMIAVDER